MRAPETGGIVRAPWGRTGVCAGGGGWQLAALRARDTSGAFVQQLSDRGWVRDPPPELAQRETLLVSGHHHDLSMRPWRLIIDSGGGLDDHPITAVVLPGRACVKSD